MVKHTTKWVELYARWDPPEDPLPIYLEPILVNRDT